MHIDSNELDRYITGNWGEDQFADEIPDTHLEEQDCRNPGRHGCQMCEACADYADRVYSLV